MSNEKNIATLSIVRNMTNSCLRKFGMNRTSFRIRNSRNVRKTLNPELPSLTPKNCWPNSNTLCVRAFVCETVYFTVMCRGTVHRKRKWDRFFRVNPCSVFPLHTVAMAKSVDEISDKWIFTWRRRRRRRHRWRNRREKSEIGRMRNVDKHEL